tara:strand:+ start:887 stop:1540 length:654 start_codon:yes stop_codon:yes gene_type:complete
MGRAIGARLSHAGHDVAFGSRKAPQAGEAASRGSESAFATTLDEAAQFGDVLIWTARIHDPSEMLRNAEMVTNKVIIDLNNRDYNDVRTGAWFAESIAEKLQGNFPKNIVVKAFNTIPMEAFDIPRDELENAQASTFVAGGDAEARRTVSTLAGDIGFSAVDLGGELAAMRAAEALGDAIRILLIDGGRTGSTHLTVSQLPRPSLGLVGERQASQYG